MTRAERLANNVTRACDAIQRDLVIEEDGKERTVASVTLQGNLHLTPGKPLCGDAAKALHDFLFENFVRKV